jgi:hypothetical protein
MDPMQQERSVSEASGYVAPRNPVESTVAAIWAELLEMERVGVDDNFLLLGGESLLATQAASRLQMKFGCEISVREIFVGTVAEIAAQIAATTQS